MTVTYCDHCGDALTSGAHERCRVAREMEPPRYCPECRRRMVVQVTPGGWTATCTRHGTHTATASPADRPGVPSPEPGTPAPPR